MRGCKVGRDLLTPPEVYFVGCLASEGCMWNYGVVLLDVECDQLLKGSEGVERMQVEPAMLAVRLTWPAGAATSESPAPC